ncbi:MAG: phage tail assembly protein [Lachnospiraceae bacterium]|nr:phage tail assembly protein [Lachnospiraceae bacterium]
MGKEAEVMENAVVASEVTETVEEETSVVTFAKPYKFEGKEYTEIDLAPLEDITGTDMIKVNNLMKRTSGGGVEVMPEVTLDYAFHISAIATKMPVEFFSGLPAKECLKVKNKVMGFLFGQE